MNDKNGFMISNRDRVFKAWLDCTELVRDWQDYAQELSEDDKELAKLFAEYSESEALQASKLLEILQGYDR